MRLRNNPKADEILSQYPHLVIQKETLKDLPVNQLFKEKPLEIEIGMGKGDFILEMAKRHPETFFVDIFETHSIHKIYLNFSDPWPKKKHEKRRLTHAHFLDIYRQLLEKEGYLEFKTDNRSLFEYTLKSMNQYGMIFEEISLDLHHSDMAAENIMSEYEKKFSSQGPIYRLKAKFKEEA